MTQKSKPQAQIVDDITQVLLIGGAGFIGAHLAQALLKKGCFVYCLDEDTPPNNFNLLPVMAHKNFKFLKFKKSPLNKIEFLQFDYIFYLRPLTKNLELTADLLEFSQKQNAKFLLVSSSLEEPKKKINETISSKYFSRLQVDVRIVRLPYVYGPLMNLKKEDEISQLFQNYKSEKIFKISGDGSKPLYPLYIDDAIDGILKAMFSQDSKGKIYSLAESQKVSLLKFANALKKATGRTLGIEFVPKKTTPKINLQKRQILETQKQLNWRPRTSLNFGIKKTAAWLKKMPVFKKQSKTKKATQIFLIFIFLLLILASIPFITISYFYYQGVRKSQVLAQNLAQLKFDQVSELAPQNIVYLEKGKQYLLSLKPATSVLGLQKISQTLFNVFDLSLELNQTALLMGQTSQQLDQLVGLIMQGENGDINQQIGQVDLYLAELWQHLNQFEIAENQSQAAAIKNQLPWGKKQIELSREFLKNFRPLIGLGETGSKKNYLVLLQNNLELRPTGGFVSAFGLLSFENGKLLDFQVFETSSADSQLKGKVQPPEALKKYLGESSWYLRDANWSAHFPDAAFQAQWFLENSLKRTTDGTFSLDLYGLKKILTALGPVAIDSSQELITADNLWDRAQFYQKDKDFLYLLAQDLFKKAGQGSQNDWLKLAGAINSGLEQKDILVSVAAQKPSAFFNTHGWDGSVREIGQQEGVLTDYLMLVEANLGVNQANYYLNREIIQQLDILETGEVQAKTTIVYQNQSPSSKKPGGDLKNYLRIYLPLQTQVKQVSIGKDSASLQKIASNQIDQVNDYAKRGVGFLVEVPAGEKRIVTLEYTLSKLIVWQENKASYALYFQKQPGMGESNLSLQVNYPADWQLLKSVPPGQNLVPQVQITSTTLKDQAFLLEFSR